VVKRGRAISTPNFKTLLIAMKYCEYSGCNEKAEGVLVGLKTTTA
jgi:hypothetical protein